MQKLVKLPLIFFFVAAGIGGVLRWHQTWPIQGMTYPFWLHAHSHIMFLGWVFNALSVNFVLQFVPPHLHARYSTIFWIINFLLGGMLLSFPTGGYSVYSILLSTIHTAFVILFIYRFFRDAVSIENNLALRYARWALIFFMISSVGPFALGGLVANGMEQTSWYRLAVYYYLHFQYNGVFTFGVLALFYCLLFQHQIAVEEISGRKAHILFCIACFPAYVLSALYLEPGVIYNGIGFLSGGIQLVAFVFLIKSSGTGFNALLSKVPGSARVLLVIALLSFSVKLILQLTSSWPSVAHLANDFRHYVIAYLHLVFIGMISFFLLAYYRVISVIPFIRWPIMILLLGGYLISELAMISIGYTPSNFIQVSLPIGAIVTAMGIASITMSSLQGEPERGK